MWQHMFCVSVMCSALRRELYSSKHMLPHNNTAVFMNILNILSNE